MIQTNNSKGQRNKSKNLARRERLHPDRPITIYKFDCWPCAELPQHLWDTAKLMQQLWNELVTFLNKVREQDSADLDKAARKLVYGQIDLKALRTIAQGYKGVLPSACYYAVVDRFLITFREWQKAPKIKGAPHFKHSLDTINIPLIFNQGYSAEWLNSAAASAPTQIEFIAKKDIQFYKKHDLRRYIRNGFFDVGVKHERIDLHVAAHRSLPDVGRIKRVSLVGKHEQGLAGRGRTLGTKLLKELAERGLYLFTNEVAKGIAAELEIPEGYLPQLLFWEALHK